MVGFMEMIEQTPLETPSIVTVQSNQSRHRVFVYGTLKRGGRYHEGTLDTDNCDLVKAGATLYGHGLADLGSYPGLFIVSDSGEANVSGEIYEVPDTILYELDRIEGVDHGLYTRTWNESIEAWVYLYTWQGEGGPLPLEYLEWLSMYSVGVSFDESTSTFVWNNLDKKDLV